MEDISLYGYQEEVVRPALDGKNIIIWLPTGGGKTRAAVYVAKKHLETTPNAKVAVLINQVNLVDQHYAKEFNPFLGKKYKVVPISGDCSQKDFFGQVVKDNDVVICTAQILENALKNMDEIKHVELTDFTLLIIDECHHTQKDSVYNKIMGRYLERKLQGERRLPQVLGLTASLGTGGAKTADGAKEHVLKICANLDASAIISSKEYAPELQKKVPKPKKQYDIVEKRLQDPFGDHLKWMMGMIHEFAMETDDIKEFGTQLYEADVVNLETKGIQTENRQLARCARHLRKYNDALLINDTVRMVDALRILENFYSAKRERSSNMDVSDLFLSGLFDENKAELQALARQTPFENPKLAKLQSTLLGQSWAGTCSRGILFTKTRMSAHCLYDWVVANSQLLDAGIRAATLTGAGNQASHMTQNDQKRTILRFRKGELNLLISTSVAEEGLDIPECNMVVRYGLLTNEIAMQQASGRARADNSVYSVVAQEGGREVQREKTNEYLEDLSRKVIEEVQRMDPTTFRRLVTEQQNESMITRRLAELQTDKRRRSYRPDQVRLCCRNCYVSVCRGNDIQLINNAHYVNVNPQFAEHYRAGGQVHINRSFEDWEPGCVISCAKCSQEWGMEIIYKKINLPNLAIKNFYMETPDGKKPGKKWKDVLFPIEDFNFSEYCMAKYPSLLE